MIDIQQLFERFSNANYFSRADNSHILEIHIGLDDKERKAIELRARFTPKKVTGTAAIEVNQYKKPEYNTIRFSLCNEEMSGLFYKFCEDLLEQTRELKDRSEGYNAIINRFFQWKKMFVASKGTLLSEPEIMGLIGEILFLKNKLIPMLGIYDALKSWSGQELTHKDFSYGDTWAEVKSIGTGKSTVRISSLEQLDSDNVGILAVYSLEKMSTAYKGVTLNKLIVDVRNQIDNSEDRDLFMSKVALQGYEYNNYYDDYVYEISGFRQFQVIEGFPRLTSGNVSAAIKKVSYEIALSDLLEYEVNES